MGNLTNVPTDEEMREETTEVSVHSARYPEKQKSHRSPMTARRDGCLMTAR